MKIIDTIKNGLRIPLEYKNDDELIASLILEAIDFLKNSGINSAIIAGAYNNNNFDQYPQLQSLIRGYVQLHYSKTEGMIEFSSTYNQMLTNALFIYKEK